MEAGASSMKTTRRTFLKLSAIAGGSALLPGVSGLVEAAKPKPLRLLILGGTGFTGPLQVKYALSRGHKVTVCYCGRTIPSAIPMESVKLICINIRTPVVLM